MSALDAAPGTSGDLPVAGVARGAPAREAPTALPAPAAPAAQAAALSLQASPLTGVSSASGPVDLGLGPGPAAAGLLLAALAVVALVLARRRHRAPRVVEILESASLGPRRALVVARLGDEVLLLGSSEGGISLLSTRPAADVVRAAATAHLAADAPAPPPSTSGVSARPLPRLAARALAALRRARPAPAPVPPGRKPAFESLLAESVEDAELRRKLAEGGVGSVR